MQLTTWKQKLQQASFRGVTFSVTGDELAGGRRVEQHEYPGRDIPWAEDHGRRARSYTLSIFVLSTDTEDYIQRREKLIKALERGGKGELLHPQYGSTDVVVDEYSVSHSNSARGQAEFEITFLEAGAQTLPALSIDTKSAVDDAVGSCKVAAEEEFDKKLSLAGKADFVIDSARTRVESTLTSLKKVNGRINSALQPVASLTQSINTIGNELGDLIRTPLVMANTVSNLFAEVYGLADDVTVAVRSYRQLRDTFNITSSFGGSTPSQLAQTANDLALANFMSVSNTIAMMDAVAEQTSAINITSNADSPFESVQDALALRDELISDIDKAAATAGMELFDRIANLRRDFALHLNAHGVGLPRLATHTFDEPLPLVVAVYELYGSHANDAVFNDMIKRNKIPDPLRIPAGYALEYLRV